MRILITGFVVFVIWSVFSVWLYLNKIKPSMDGPVTERPVQELQGRMVDSVAQMDTLPQQEIILPEDMIVYFKFDDASFTGNQEADMHIGEFKTWLESNPGSVLSITGHTDSKGPPGYNRKLGMRRAQTMQKYFVRKGIHANQLQTTSKGEDEPIAEQATESGRAKNRRAVITIKN